MSDSKPSGVKALAVVVLLLGLVAAAVLVIAGVVGLMGEPPKEPPAMAVQRIGWGLFTGFLAVGFYVALLSLADLAEASREQKPAASNDSHDLLAMLSSQHEVLKELREAAWLSDAAKTIAFRNKDRDALRKAIREDVEQLDWEGAYYLIDEMERRFGYRHEAESLRQEVDKRRQESVDRKVDEAVEGVEQLLATHEWVKARHEYERLARLYPTSAKIRALPERMEQARNQYKNRLIKDFKAAADRNENEKAMDILKELDRYLTPKEAETYQEIARGVIKERQRNLQVSFSLARTERNWHVALESASQIIDEFPNSRMADEAKELLPKLRELAGMGAA